MGYDLDVIITRVIHSDNYTTNISPMYYEAYKVIKQDDTLPTYVYKHIDDWHEAVQLDQMYSMPVLKRMIKELKSNPDKYKKMNPENEWGDYKGAIKFLEDAYNAMLISEECKIKLEW